MAETPLEYDYLYKILLVGDPSVDKSCFFRALTHESSFPTIGVDFRVWMVEDNNGKRSKLQIWDTSGQERFGMILSSYYRSSRAILLCFNVAQRHTFEILEQWFTLTLQYASPTICIIVAGINVDQEDTRVVSYDEAAAFAAAKGALSYVEVSHENSEAVLKKLMKKIQNRCEIALDASPFSAPLLHIVAGISNS